MYLSCNYKNVENDKSKVLDKNKLIIVYYANVGGMTKSKSIYLINSIQNMLNNKFDESVKSIVVPITNGETHLEFVNADKLSDFDFDKLYENIEQLKMMI